jgi:hypothetical protein
MNHCDQGDKDEWATASKTSALRGKVRRFIARPDAGSEQVLGTWRVTASSATSPTALRLTTSAAKTSAAPLAAAAVHPTRVQQNDLVVFADHADTWKVVAPVNGSKADIRRVAGFDTRVLTAPLESIRVVRRAGSPGYCY